MRAATPSDRLRNRAQKALTKMVTQDCYRNCLHAPHGEELTVKRRDFAWSTVRSGSTAKILRHGVASVKVSAPEYCADCCVRVVAE